MGVKIALISYHKNIDKIYPAEWIDEYRSSILTQTYKDFDIFECDYGAGSKRIFDTPFYMSKSFDTFVDCMNFMISHCFNSGYDYVLNSNVDDYYSINRIERQLVFLNKGFDLVSSNFSLIEDGNVVETHRFDRLNLRRELGRNHNIIAHPAVAYSKKFWIHNKYIPSEIPMEDLCLWKRAIYQHKFIILQDVLLFHRLHSNSVCKSNNR